MATADPLLSQKSKKGGDIDDSDILGLAEAPTSIREGLELYKKGQVETFSYNPSLGDVPALSVPDFLPDLAGCLVWSLWKVWHFKTLIYNINVFIWFQDHYVIWGMTDLRHNI